MSIQSIADPRREGSAVQADRLKISHRLLSAQQLPNEIWATIAEWLPKCSAEGLPLALNSMHNLVCVSKKMHLVFNDIHVTRRFLEVCARKYGKEVEEVASQLKTMGAYLFLCRYIYANRLDKMYEVTQQLYPLTSEICRQAEHLFETQEGALFVWSYHVSSHSFLNKVQTVQGLVLHINRQYVKLAHPFGVIMIYNKWWQKPQLSKLILSVATALIDLLNAHFQGFLSDLDHILDWPRNTVYHVIPVGPSRRVTRTKMEVIESKQCNEREVGQTLVLSAHKFYHTLYACRRAFETVLPHPNMPTCPITPERHRLMKALFWILKKKREVGESKVLTDSSVLNDTAPR